MTSTINNLYRNDCMFLIFFPPIAHSLTIHFCIVLLTFFKTTGIEEKDINDNSLYEEDKEDEKLSSIINYPYATTYITEDGKRRRRCKWCKKDLALWNITMALYHLVKKAKVDIAPYQASIREDSMKQYIE
jgi:hypothetical protein